MAKILVHLTHGPEHPTRAALAFLVAKAAVEEGHTVTLSLNGDAVQLLRDAVLENLSGWGTGKLRESYDAVVAGGAKIYLAQAAHGLETVSDEIVTKVRDVMRDKEKQGKSGGRLATGRRMYPAGHHGQS
jgi:predicted peroxiredoxin